jgi:hypothetical protein
MAVGLSAHGCVPMSQCLLVAQEKSYTAPLPPSSRYPLTLSPGLCSVLLPRA